MKCWNPSGGQFKKILEVCERVFFVTEIVPVHSANLQFKITYKQPNIENLQHQFDGLVYKYNDIFCPYPEECGIGDLQIKSAVSDRSRRTIFISSLLNKKFFEIYIYYCIGLASNEY